MESRKAGSPDAREVGRETGAPAPARRSGLLGRLLDVEARLDAMLEARRAEAEERVREARQEAGRLLERVEAEVRDELEGRRRRIREEGRRRVARTRDEAAAAARRWRSLPADDVDDLARLAVSRVLRPPGAEAGP